MQYTGKNGNLADLLDAHMKAVRIGSKSLADKANEIAGQELLHRNNITNWRKGHSRSVQNWWQMVLIASALELNEADTEELLKVSDLPSLHRLYDAAADEQKKYFDHWKTPQPPPSTTQTLPQPAKPAEDPRIPPSKLTTKQIVILIGVAIAVLVVLFLVTKPGVFGTAMESTTPIAQVSKTAELTNTPQATSTRLSTNTPTPAPSPTVTATEAVVLPPAKSWCGGTAVTVPLSEQFNAELGFTIYTTENSYAVEKGGGLLSNFVRTVLVDADGVWVGYADSPDGGFGLSHISNVIEWPNREWELCRTSEGNMVARHVNAIVGNEKETLWVATDGGGIWQLKDEVWSQFVNNQSVDTVNWPDRATYDISFKGDGLVWAATLYGVNQYDGDKWIKLLNLPQRGLAHTIAVAPNGEVWVGFLGEGIYRIFPDDSVEVYQADDAGLSNHDVIDIVFDNDGRAWIGTEGGGLNVFDDGEWVTYTAADSLILSDNVQVVVGDKFGRIWVGTDRGVTYIDPDTLTTHIYNKFNTLAIGVGVSGREHCQFEDDHLWIGTRGQGLTHSRLPSPNEVIASATVEGVPDTLSPGESFSPIVTITMENEYRMGPADFLRVTTDDFTQHPSVVPESLETDGTYTFHLTKDNSISISEDQEPGVYQSVWRLWQCGRYVGEPVTIEFVVAGG